MMAWRKGFTLMEIIVTLVIVGVLAAVALPGFGILIERNNATTAQTNLLAIYSAQMKYMASHNGSYCVGATCGSIGAINNNLGLAIRNDGFDYSCVNYSFDPDSFSCWAKRQGNPEFFLYMMNDNINLTGTGTQRNPACSSGGKGYCPAGDTDHIPYDPDPPPEL